MSAVKVNDASPAGPDGAGVYWANFSNPAYSGGMWNFTVNNTNAFNITGLNLTSITWYRRAVSDVGVDIGSDGTVDWTSPGVLDGTVTVTLPASILSAAHKNPPPVSDTFGNELCTVSLTVVTGGWGTVTVGNMSLPYNYTAQMQSFYGHLTMYLMGKPKGTVTMPLFVHANSSGSVRLSGLSVLTDTAPRLVNRIPSTYSIPEESDNSTLINLNQYFADDFDSTLTYSLWGNTNDSQVRVSINGSWLGIRCVLANWSGTTELEINATDSRSQRTVSNRFTISVTPVNDGPVIVSWPSGVLQSELGRNFTYQVQANDSDSPAIIYTLTEGPAGMTVNATGGLSWRPAPSDVGVKYNVSVNISDGNLSTTLRFQLTVWSRNTPPVIDPRVNATSFVGKPYTGKINATDSENDHLTFSLDRAPTGMVINATTGVIGWPAPLEGNATVIVNVTDGISSATFTFSLRTVRNAAPKITSSPPTKVKAGEKLSYQMKATDADGQPLFFGIETPLPGMSMSAAGLFTWTATENQKGNQHIVLTVYDGADTTSQSFDVEVSQKGLLGGGASDWLIIVFVIIIIAAVAGAAIYLLKRKKTADGKFPEMPKGGPTPESAPETAITSGPQVVVEDIFVVYKDGRLVHHLTNRLKPMDHDVMASMFTAVQEFMKDSVGAEKIDSINYGENTILFEGGKNISLAVVVTGEHAGELRPRMKSSIADIELQCGALLEKWDGNSAPLKKDLDLLLKNITDLPRFRKKGAGRRPDEFVNLLSGLEFYRGYVRMKIAVQNELDAVITDASIKIIVKQEAIKLSHIEPEEYRFSGDEIAIGNVQPEEKVTVAVYLDPMICTNSFLDATLTFKDSKGELFSIVMARKRVEVVCPMFHTDEEINVAILRKMISEFAQHDSKVYSLPAGLSAEDAFGMGKSVIESHNVKLVREFTETKTAFTAEAWYFGRTQVKKDQVVMRISVSREANSLEFFTGSTDLAAITGLLAEFGHELNKRLKDKGVITAPITHLDLTEKDRVIRKSSLLIHRFAEAEADAGENEPKTQG